MLSIARIALFLHGIELAVLLLWMAAALGRPGLVDVGVRHRVSFDRMSVLRRLDLAYVVALGLRALLGLIVRVVFLRMGRGITYKLLDNVWRKLVA